MPLKLMYITNRPDVARIAESAGVDRIFVDMEYIGKADRQGGMDTVQSHHTVEDIKKIKAVLNTAELLVRVNPIHKESPQYNSSKAEIDAVIAAGADIVMLPFFKTLEEVRTFLELVDRRTKTMLLVETPEAVDLVDEIIDIDGIDEVFIGLNDLSLGYGMRFMFEPLANGTVERLCLKFRQRGLLYGFGGIAALGKGILPAEYIIKEHYRLGSTSTILSRSFCDVRNCHNGEINSIFMDGVREIRAFEKTCEEHLDFFTQNKMVIKQRVSMIVGGLDLKGENNEEKCDNDSVS